MAVVIRPHRDASGQVVRSILVEKLDAESVLSKLGHSLERFLTETPESYNRMLKGASKDGVAIDEDSASSSPSAYHYTQAGAMLLRSQIDCHHPSLPRRTFDLKTRATLPIRMDIFNYRQYLDYRLVRQHGLLQSFEREQYDMARSAFLKYDFQARIGGMDGIFVAYHNTANIFGFQYLAREAIDEVLFGGAAGGDVVFKSVLLLYNHLLGHVIPADDDLVYRLTFSLTKDCAKLTLFVESFPEADYPVTHQKTDGIPAPAATFRQFTVTTGCSFNGIRTDAIPLDSIAAREDATLTTSTTTLHISITEQPSPNRLDFENARGRSSEPRYRSEDSSSLNATIMRSIGTTKLF
jgi:hypothetical protein